MGAIYSTSKYFKLILSTVDSNGVDTIPDGITITSYKIAVKYQEGGVITEFSADRDPVLKTVTYTNIGVAPFTKIGTYAYWVVLYADGDIRIPGSTSYFEVEEEGI